MDKTETFLLCSVAAARSGAIGALTFHSSRDAMKKVTPREAAAMDDESGRCGHVALSDAQA